MPPVDRIVDGEMLSNFEFVPIRNLQVRRAQAQVHIWKVPSLCDCDGVRFLIIHTTAIALLNTKVSIISIWAILSSERVHTISIIVHTVPRVRTRFFDAIEDSSTIHKNLKILKYQSHEPWNNDLIQVIMIYFSRAFHFLERSEVFDPQVTIPKRAMSSTSTSYSDVCLTRTQY